MATTLNEVVATSTSGVEANGALRSIISGIPACKVQPFRFFVAWQGVLTLAFSGIPPSLCQVKENFVAKCNGLVKENPGSKWPKTTLGCLYEGKYLSMEQLKELYRICSEESEGLSSSKHELVDNLSLVVYENCCLEKIVVETRLQLAFPADLSEPSQREKDSVQKVMDQFSESTLEEYHHDVSKDGNRSLHYRKSRIGVTLVHFLSEYPKFLDKFKRRVEGALPGMYDWFSGSSLHMTVRAVT